MNNTFTERIKLLFQKVVNRETIAYVIAGVLTTGVNFISYIGLYDLGIPNMVANTLAWVIAVIFAYLVNKKNVFQSKSHSLKDEAAKISKFIGSRIITLLIETAGMLLFTEMIKFNRLLVKACIAVIVIILNYVFSKLFIFNKKEPEKHAQEQHELHAQEQNDQEQNDQEQNDQEQNDQEQNDQEHNDQEQNDQEQQ